mgnify:FL=1
MKQINSMTEIDALKKGNDMLLVYFGSNTCSVCCDLLPKIDQMLGNYPGISAVKVDIQKSPALSASFSVLRHRQSSCLFRKRKPCGKRG